MPVSVFGRYPPVGFGYRFFTLGYLIATWIFVWRSFAQRFNWSNLVRGAIPTGLFVLPLAALCAIDKTLGKGKGDWTSAVFLLVVIAVGCAKREWQ